MWFNYLNKLLFYGLALILLTAISGMLYMENAIHLYTSPESYRSTIERVQNTPNIPKSYYTLLAELRPDFISSNPWRANFNTKWLSNGNGCPCSEVYFHPGYFEHYSFLAPYVYQLALHNQLGEKKCYEYQMDEFLMQNRYTDLETFTQAHFKKSIAELTILEVQVLDNFIHHPSEYLNFRKENRLNDD